MKTISPLRYPGGKSSMTSLLRQIFKLNGLGGRSIAEPFAGGAGASLALLFLEEVEKIHINDADPAIYDFWWSLTNRSEEFLRTLRKAKVNISEWKRQRNTYRSKRKVGQLKRGFSAFFLNRCNRSGIIMNGGPIGGIKQDGKWKLNARFNKNNLGDRCGKIAEYRERIEVSCLDGISFIEKLELSKTFMFIDPPYFEKGDLLYMNLLDENYHANLAKRLNRLVDMPWVVTYDDCPEIRKIYRGWANVRPFSLRYAAAERRRGSEVLISPKWMKLPKLQGSAAISW